MDNLEKGKYKIIQEIKVEFDQSAIWNRIQSYNEKRKRRLVLFWTFAVLLLGISGIMFYKMQKHIGIIKNNNFEKTVIALEHKEINDAEKVNPKPRLTLEESTVSKALIDVNLDGNSYKKNNKPRHKSKSNQRTTIVKKQDRPCKSILKNSFNSTKNNDTFIRDKAKKKRIKIADMNEAISIPMSPIYIVFKKNTKDRNPIIPFVNSHSKLKLFNLFLFTSLGKVYRDFESDDQIYISNRKLSETTLEEIGVGINISRTIFNGFYVKTGLNYHQITTKVFYKLNNVSNLLDVYPKDIPKEFIGREGLILRKKTYTYFNIKKDFVIPLLFGYKFINKHSSYEIEGGVGFNLYTKYSGHILNNENEFSSIDKILLKSGALNYNLNFLYIRKIGLMQLYLGPGFRWVSTVEFANHSELFRTFSIRFGIKI